MDVKEKTSDYLKLYIHSNIIETIRSEFNYTMKQIDNRTDLNKENKIILGNCLTVLESQIVDTIKGYKK